MKKKNNGNHTDRRKHIEGRSHFFSVVHWWQIPFSIIVAVMMLFQTFWLVDKFLIRPESTNRDTKSSALLPVRYFRCDIQFNLAEVKFKFSFILEKKARAREKKTVILWNKTFTHLQGKVNIPVSFLVPFSFSCSHLKSSDFFRSTEISNKTPPMQHKQKEKEKKRTTA